MDLDIILPIVAGLAAFANVAMGFWVSIFPSDKPKKLTHPAIFIVIGLIGVAAVILSAVRNSNQTNRIETDVGSISHQLGISPKQTLQQQLGQISSALHSIASAQTRTQALPGPVSQPIVPISTQQSPPARIVVTHFEVVPSTTDPNTAYHINVTLKNDGQGVGYAPMVTSIVQFEDNIVPQPVLNSLVAKTTAASLKQRPTRQQQIEVGQENWITLPWSISHDQWADVISGKKRMYLFLSVTFVDDTLKNGLTWVSEYCGSESLDMNTVLVCGQRTFLNSGHHH